MLEASMTRTSSGRLVLLAVLAAVLGLMAGVAAFVLIRLIALLTNLALLHRVGWKLPSLAALHPSVWTLVAATAGGLLVSLLALWSPVIRGHGIPEAMEAILTRQSRISPRAAVAKPMSAAVAIGTGGPFGAEGPIIVTGGALGSLIGQVIKVSPAERKILLACGAAAGMAATFGAPLAAVVLAIELLLFEFTTRAFIPLVVASSVAAGVHAALFGTGPLFSVPHHQYAGLANLPFFVVLGPLCGLMAVLVTKGLFAVEAAYRRLPVHPFWHPLIGAAGFATIGLVVPRALGVGYDSIGDVLAARLALGTVAVLLVAKLLAWWVALGSGTSGGTLAPLLLIGGSFGGLFGALAGRLVPGLHLSPGAFAVVGMAAVFGAATRATFASIVFVFELTHDFNVVLPLMLASVLADLVAAALLHDSLMTEKLARRGLRVHAEYHVDALQTARVEEVMTRDVKTLPASAGLDVVRAAFGQRGHGAYPLLGPKGRLLGIVARGDLLREIPAGATAIEVGSTDVVTVGPDEPLVSALERMLDEGVEHLPVMEEGRLIGICTRTDVLRIRTRQLEAERRQPGWRPPVRRKWGRSRRITPGEGTRASPSR
jgi:H+/Cl- antiporter ClcA/CBS domain-containing protein